MEILKNTQFAGYDADELVPSFLWKCKQRQILAVVLPGGRPLYGWGEVNKLDVFEIPPKLKKAPASSLVSAAASVILGTPIRAAAIVNQQWLVIWQGVFRCGTLVPLVSIPRAKNLSPEAKAVEERAIQLLKRNLEALIADYRKRFGPLVGTDFARELFPEYAASLESRMLYAAAVQKSAAHLADAVFERVIQEQSGRSEQPIAVFTAGGTGAGKTSSIQANTATNAVLNEAQAVYDSNLNSFESAKQKIDFALEHGYRVLIIFILREPVPAFVDGVLPRAVREGRTVPIDGHIRMHKDSLKTFGRLRKYYQGNQNVDFMVLSNTGAEGEAALADVERLNEVRYDREELEHELQERLEREYSSGKISKAIYDSSRVR